MRTENYKHGVVSLMLVFALVFSVVTISAPLASAGDWTNRPAPGGTIIQVAAGENFLIRHELAFDSAADNGAYTVTISWANYNNLASENLTFLMAEAYFTSGDYTGEQLLAQTTLASSPSGSDTIWALSVSCPADQKDNRDGDFNVDIWLEASGVGGVPHTAAGAVGDNHPIPPSGDQLGGVIVIEPSLSSWNRAPITIDVVGVGVTVDVTPDFQQDWQGEDLIYTVTVNNTGESADNFALVATDNSGWTLDVSPSTLEIAGSGSDTATLTVTVGDGIDNVTVTATGTWASGSDSVIAKKREGPSVEIEVEPDYKEGLPGENITYSVFIHNKGTVVDNYTVTVEDTEDPDWNTHFSVATIYPTDDSHVAENCPDTVGDGGTDYNMYVGYESSPYCVGAQGWKTRAYLMFDVSSIPAGSTINSATLNAKVQYGPSTGYPSYTPDNMPTDVKSVSGDAWDETTLTWNNAPAPGATLDTVTVIDDLTAGQYVWYSWDVASFVDTEVDGDGVVSLCMLSENKESDNTDCTVWFYTKDATGTSDDPYLEINYIAPGAIIVGPLSPCENVIRTLTVEIPSDATPCTLNDITVTATSEENDQVFDSETVQAHVKALKAVGVEATPDEQANCPKKPLNYYVTITNTGEEDDNFELVLSDDNGWNPTWDLVAQIMPTDDSGVSSEFPDQVEDGGVDYNTYNGWTPTYGAQRNYFRFDISEVPHGSWIKSATFWATGRYGPSYPGYTDTYHLVDAMSVEDDDWEESTLTWNTAPAMGSVLDTENFAGDLFVPQWTWLSWDVTDFVESEFFVDQVVTIGLKAQVENEDIHPNGGSAGWFKTKDDPGYWMEYACYLEIVYMPGVSDTIQVSLDAGDSVTLGFGVIVPAWATPNLEDTITVTATSLSDPSVENESSVVARSNPLRIVEASIEGPDWQETYKDPLTYVVKIHNAGQIADMYKLTAYDKRGWPVRIEPQEIYLKPDHSAEAALSVTIPYQTPGSTTDLIFVDITGKLASGTFTDPENSSASVSVEAHQKEVKQVNVEVRPSIHQTGHPGSELTWLVTVTNEGNVPDSYVLGLSQYVYDKTDRSPYEEWEGGFLTVDGQAIEVVGPLDPGEEASILLRLRVPWEDMRTCVQNTIDVTAISVQEAAEYLVGSADGPYITSLGPDTRLEVLEGAYLPYTPKPCDWLHIYYEGTDIWAHVVDVYPEGEGYVIVIDEVTWIDESGERQTGTFVLPDVPELSVDAVADIEWVGAQVREQKPHVPQGEIELQAVAGFVAIDIWPTYYDFGVLNEMETAATPPNYFTIRNVGNVDVTLWIVGMDAISKPGEPAADWQLGDGIIGVNTYALWWTEDGEIVDTVTKEEKLMSELLEPHDETYFDLTIQAPSTFTTPAKMWMKVAITARKIHY